MLQSNPTGCAGERKAGRQKSTKNAVLDSIKYRGDRVGVGVFFQNFLRGSISQL